MIIYEEEPSDKLALGGKAAGLYRLRRHGFPVPDFFVVSDDTDLNSEEILKKIDESCDGLGCEEFAVRSSAANEDGKDRSFAGQYDTFLHVKKSEVINALKKVFESAKSARINSYKEHFNLGEGGVSAVVQRQISPEVSGVMFTSSPYDSEKIIVEEVDGECKNLVDGSKTPRTITIAKNSAAQNSAVSADYLAELAKAAAIIESAEGASDVEWAVEKGKLYFLQLRPLTAMEEPIILKEAKRNLYVYRNFAVFPHSVQAKASLPEEQRKVYGFNLPIFDGVLVNGREFYSEENDVLCGDLWKRLDEENPKFFENFISAIEKNVKRAQKAVGELEKSTKREIGIADYDFFLNEYLRSYLPLMMRPDDYLTEKFAKQISCSADEIITDLSYSGRRTFYGDEKTDFLKAAIKGEFGGYIKKYEWVKNPLGYGFAEPTETECFERAGKLRDYRESLKIYRRNAAKLKENKRKAYAKLPKEAKKTAKLIEKFVFLRTYATENSDRLFFYFKKRILKRLAEERGASLDVALSLDTDEAREFFKNGNLPLDLSDRRKGEAIVFENGEYRTYYGVKCCLLLKKLMPETSSDGELKGMVACMGEATARVTIVRNADDARNFPSGNILVATMTVPELTPAMERASGIITDEGGVTCHAAIIAREYGIPCLVGTGNATSVFSNGDNVFLDCINGRAKKLD